MVSTQAEQPVVGLHPKQSMSRRHSGVSDSSGRHELLSWEIVLEMEWVAKGDFMG
jgi:hypothetical protein